MPKLDDLLNNLVYPLLFLILAPSATIFGSHLATGDYANWINQIPITVKIGFIIFVFVWIIIVLVRKRLKAIEPSGVRATSVSRWGYEDIGNIDHDGVKWRIIAPLPPPSSLYRGPDLTPSRIRVRTPPRCPECETDIEQSKSFWGGYIWKCVRCNWRKRSKESYYSVKERVEKIAQREMEKKFSARELPS